MRLALAAVFLAAFSSSIAGQPQGMPGFSSGSLAQRPDFEAFVSPPPQEGTDSSWWRVEPDVSLFRFAEGEG